MIGSWNKKVFKKVKKVHQQPSRKTQTAIQTHQSHQVKSTTSTHPTKDTNRNANSQAPLTLMIQRDPTFKCTHLTSTSKRREAKTMKGSTRLAHLGSSSVTTKHKYTKKKDSKKTNLQQQKLQTHISEEIRQTILPPRRRSSLFRRFSTHFVGVGSSSGALPWTGLFFGASICLRNRSCTISIHFPVKMDLNIF